MDNPEFGEALVERAIPADNPHRNLTCAQSNDPGGEHIHLAGGTYTILIGGEATEGAYCLIDMLVPPGGGPAPHRHDFEEMFYLLEGEVEFTFRGKTHAAKTGDSLNIPANAPHSFKNSSNGTARLLCVCTPAGQEDFFRQVGTPANSAQEPPPNLSESEMTAFVEKAKRLAARYRTELLPPM